MRQIPFTPLTAADVDWQAVRASGPGGQHVNKTSSAVQLRFHIEASALPDALKARLRETAHTHLVAHDLLVLREQGSRSQHRNKRAALGRLNSLLTEASIIPERRVPTTPSRAAKRKRADDKQRRAATKHLRRRPDARTD